MIDLTFLFLRVSEANEISNSSHIWPGPVCRTPQCANQRYPPTNQPACEQPTNQLVNDLPTDKIAAHLPFIPNYEYLYFYY